MPIRWADLPHAEIGMVVRRRLGRNTVGRSAEDSSRHILSRRLRFLDAEEHRRFIESESRDLVALLRCTRDVYRDFVEKHNCRPVLEAYWVVLRFAVFPTAMVGLREKVIDYLRLTQVSGRDLLLLYGIRTATSHQAWKLPRFPPLDLKDVKPATDRELRALAQIVNEHTLLWFRDICDGGAVGHPQGGGPFAVDDASAIQLSWGFGGLPAKTTMPEWATVREGLWHRCKPWSESLCDLFGCVQEELLSQWRALPDSQACELTLAGRPSDLKKVVVKRSGPKPKARNTVLRGIVQAARTSLRGCLPFDGQ